MKSKMIKRSLFILPIFFLLANCIQERDNSETLSTAEWKGPYLGQTLSTDAPELFAPGFISTPMFTRDITMTKDGNEIYFCISAAGYSLIYTSQQINGVWSEPQVAPFVSDDSYMFYEPHLSADDQTLFFLSNMPMKEDEEASEDIWAVDRNGDTWGQPYNLGLPVNTEGSEFYPSTTTDGTLYFTRAEKGSRINNIYRSRKVDGEYQAAEMLGPEINIGTNRYNAFVDRQERFIIVPAIGMEDSRGGTDYYISFKRDDDSWTPAINMGDKVNSENGREYSASLSPDGKYLFFMSAKTGGEKSPAYKDLLEAAQSPLNGNSNIWWVKSDFIWKLKEQSS